MAYVIAFTGITGRYIGHISCKVTIMLRFQIGKSPSGGKSFSIIGVLHGRCIAEKNEIVTSQLLGTVHEVTLSLATGPVVRQVIRKIGFRTTGFILDAAGFTLRSTAATKIHPPLGKADSFRLAAHNL